MIETTPQSDGLEEQLQGAHPVPQMALRALRGARELECEVSLLRSVLDAMPAAARRDPASKEEIVRLLSKVILFRLALADASPDKPK